MLSLAIVTVVLTHGRPEQVLALGPVRLHVPGFTLEEAIPIAIAILAVTFVQIGVAIALILHVQKNARLTPDVRIAWFLLPPFPQHPAPESPASTASARAAGPLWQVFDLEMHEIAARFRARAVLAGS